MIALGMAFFYYTIVNISAITLLNQSLEKPRLNLKHRIEVYESFLLYAHPVLADSLAFIFIIMGLLNSVFTSFIA